jgi:hypothetical protein
VLGNNESDPHWAVGDDLEVSVQAATKVPLGYATVVSEDLDFSVLAALGCTFHVKVFELEENLVHWGSWVDPPFTAEVDLVFLWVVGACDDTAVTSGNVGTTLLEDVLLGDEVVVGLESYTDVLFVGVENELQFVCARFGDDWSGEVLAAVFANEFLAIREDAVSDKVVFIADSFTTSEEEVLEGHSDLFIGETVEFIDAVEILGVATWVTWRVGGAIFAFLGSVRLVDEVAFPWGGHGA